MAKRIVDGLFAFLHPMNWFASLGRVLLGIALTVAVMIPYTQHAWIWDRFMQGGHDFETNLLLTLSFLCLVLVLGRHARQGVDALFALLRGWLTRPQRAVPALAGGLSFLYADLPDETPCSGWSLPLRI